mmetsp:Transcript_6338/g.11014  ORF Transcript_6338/g.11014 Transcript_6338/m.11014 type:complete len:660 (-) Transcript_6338:809-2788(-)
MAICGVFDLIVHVDSFRNIDLYNQGNYCLRFCFETEEGPAVPTSSESRRSRRHRDQHYLCPASTDPDSQTFDSRVFIIRYRDEEVRLQDMCIFRCHLNLESVLTMRVQLMFNEAGFDYLQGDAVKEKLRPVAETEYKIIKAEQGIQTYIPVTFGDVFFCLADVTIHTVLLNYRLNFKAPHGAQVNIEELWAIVISPGDNPDLVLEPDAAEEKHQKFIGKLQQICRNLRAYIMRVKDQLPATITFEDNLIPPDLELVHALKTGACTSRHIAEHAIKEMGEAAAYLCHVNICMKEIIKAGFRTIKSGLRRKYFSELKERYELNISKQVTQVPAYAFNAEKMRMTENVNASKIIRRSQAFMRYDPMIIEDIRFIPNDDQPIVFEELSYTESSVDEPVAGMHLFVLVHGYQGNSFDMGLLRNYVALAYPHTIVYSATSNENFSDAPIAEQAERLAKEILNQIDESGYESRLGKISFLGHSMGGIVVRAALPYLEKYSRLMHAYISLSAPHLGIAGKSNKLVGLGLWFLKKWNKSASLRELSMTDAQDRTKSFLYGLSSGTGLNWFRYVVFLSSHQDSYAPFESARIEVSPKMGEDPSLGGIFLQMAANILMHLHRPQLLRLDVNFSMKKRNIDSMIGRKAHIQFLENESLVRTLVFAYSQFFN